MNIHWRCRDSRAASGIYTVSWHNKTFRGRGLWIVIHFVAVVFGQMQSNKKSPSIREKLKFTANFNEKWIFQISDAPCIPRQDSSKFHSDNKSKAVVGSWSKSCQWHYCLWHNILRSFTSLHSTSSSFSPSVSNLATGATSIILDRPLRTSCLSPFTVSSGTNRAEWNHLTKGICAARDDIMCQNIALPISTSENTLKWSKEMFG